MNELKLSLNTLEDAKLNLFFELLQTETDRATERVETAKRILLAITDAYIADWYGGSMESEGFTKDLWSYIESIA